jgi:hypothetical protein
MVGLRAARIQATVAGMDNADERIGDDEQKADSVVFNEQESTQRVVNRFCRQFRCVGSQQAKLQEVVKQCGLTDLLSRDARKWPVEKIACFETFLGIIPELLEMVRWSASKFQHGRAIKARDKALQSISNESNRSCEAEFRHAIREPVWKSCPRQSWMRRIPRPQSGSLSRVALGFSSVVVGIRSCCHQQ